MRLSVKRLAKPMVAGRYFDEHGLYLEVKSEGNCSWQFRYQLAGEERWMGLGATHVVDLDEARESAREARKLVAKGIDPIAARKAERAAAALVAAKAMTFKEATERYLKDNDSSWSRQHAEQVASSMKEYVYPLIGKLEVQAIDTGLVLRVLEPIWKEIPETASRVRSRIERVLAWAAVRGLRTGGDNPARWAGHLREALPARHKVAPVQNFAAMPYAEVPEFVRGLCAREGIVARALEFTILTAARSGEVTGAKWAEIDLDKAVWTTWCRRLEAEVHRSVFSTADRASRQFVLDLSGMLRGDPETRWKSHDIALKHGVLTKNEVRDLEGFNALPGGDGGQS